MFRASQLKSVGTRLVYLRTTIPSTRGQQPPKLERIQQCSFSLLRYQRKLNVWNVSPISGQWFNLVIPARGFDNKYAPDILKFGYHVIRKAGLLETNIEILAPEARHAILERTQEMKKLKVMVKKVKKQNSKEVSKVYITGEPEVGKSYLARTFAKRFYSNRQSVQAKTVLTLNMAEFPKSYRKLVTRLKISHRHNKIQQMGLEIIAEQLKNILSKRSNWLLIVDNYNSREFKGIDEGCLERELLPLQQPSVSEWGTGLVLVTTNNAGVIPKNKVAGSGSTITVDPLSVEESAKLIGTLTEYELSENETQKLTTTADIKNWRYIPPVMARIGEDIGLRRERRLDYNFADYVEELERGETQDPEKKSRQSIRTALLNMTKASDAISKTFKVLAMIPDYSHRGIPLVLLERLMKVNNKEEWAHKIAEVERCTVLLVEYNSKNDYKYIKTHKRYLDEMRRIANTKELTTEQRYLVDIFIGCINKESEETFRIKVANKYTQPKLDALYEILKEYSIGAETNLDQELNMKINQTLSNLRQMLRTNSTT